MPLSLAEQFEDIARLRATTDAEDAAFQQLLERCTQLEEATGAFEALKEECHDIS